MRHFFWFTFLLILSCRSPRSYYLHTELAWLDGDPDFAVAPGPWKTDRVPVVVSDSVNVPDELVLATLRALMELPGAADSCDPSMGRPRQDAAEYCVALYRTPEDWRVSWPVRSLSGELSSCQPPFGGVEDEDFGRDVPVLGFAHNHPCGTNMSSPDLGVFPMARLGEGQWVMVAYGVTPSGRLLRDTNGSPVPAWHWLATGHLEKPRFLKWNQSGEVFKWINAEKEWEFQSNCQPASSSLLSPGALSPVCSPELNR